VYNRKMLQSLTKRFTATFAKGIWSEVPSRVVDGAIFLAAILWVVYVNGFSWGRIIEGRWHAAMLAVWAVAAVIIWHAFRSAYVVTREVTEERKVARPSKSRILSPSGESIELPLVSHSRPALKLFGIATLLTLLMFVLSYFALKEWGSRPVTAFTAGPAAEKQSGNLDVPLAVVFVPRLELIPFKVGDPTVLIPYCENVGSQTALEAAQVSNAIEVDVDDPTKPDYVSASKTDWVYKNWPHPQGLGVSTIPPGKCTHVWLVGEKLTKLRKKQLDEGTKVLVWVGFSSWRDAHGEFKYEQCYWRRSNSEWTICENHNGIKFLVEKPLSEQSPTTSENIEAHIQEWSNDAGITITDVSGNFPESIFTNHLVLGNGTSLLVMQPKLRDQYIIFHVGIGITDPVQKSSFYKLSTKKRTDLLRSITIEMNRLRIECAVNSTTNNTVELRRTLLISATTNESFSNTLQDLNSALALVEALIQQGLEQPSEK